MLRARGLTEALEELARLVEEAHLDSRAPPPLSDGLPVRGRPSPEKAAASSEMSGLLHSIDVAAQRVREYISADGGGDTAVANAPSAATARPPSSAFAYGSAAVSASARGTSRAASRSASCDGQSLNGIDEGGSEPSALAPAAAPRRRRLHARRLRQHLWRCRRRRRRRRRRNPRRRRRRRRPGLRRRRQRRLSERRRRSPAPRAVAAAAAAAARRRRRPTRECPTASTSAPWRGRSPGSCSAASSCSSVCACSSRIRTSRACAARR